MGWKQEPLTVGDPIVHPNSGRGWGLALIKIQLQAQPFCWDKCWFQNTRGFFCDCIKLHASTTDPRLNLHDVVLYSEQATADMRNIHGIGDFDSSTCIPCDFLYQLPYSLSTVIRVNEKNRLISSISEILLHMWYWLIDWLIDNGYLFTRLLYRFWGNMRISINRVNDDFSLYKCGTIVFSKPSAIICS